MSSDAAVRQLVESLAALRFANAFNPYSDSYSPFDLDEAPVIRRDNLTYVLEAAARSGVADVWIGLELGHNGGRRTGLAMTDDRHLAAHAARFGVSEKVRLATQSGPHSEMTAGIVWEALSALERPVFLWNVVPVHPHRPSEPLSNRRHTAIEREHCAPILRDLISLLKPDRLVAVGGDASTALAVAGYDHVAVRHPAFGGKRLFLDQIKALG